MTCETANKKLIEAARRAGFLDAALQTHLDVCLACTEHWREQVALSAGLRQVRLHAAPRRSSDASRAALLQTFAARQQTSSSNRRWLWSFAAAAVFLLGAFLVREAISRPTQSLPLTASSAPSTNGLPSAIETQETESQQDGFIDVPYAPPLAEGELVRVVHTELQPAALASLGVNVDPSWTTELPADLLVGQDGFPRAVRVSNESSSDGSD